MAAPAKALQGTTMQVWLLEQNYLAALHLRQILDRCPSFAVTTLDEVSLAHLPPESDCVFVIDKATLSLPFAACLQAIRMAVSQASILVIDRQRTMREILELIPLGVLGFVAYPDVENQLIPAIEFVAEKQLWLKAEAASARVAINVLTGPLATQQFLTGRERSVIELLQQRLSNKQISAELRISESTVKFHLANIFSKLGLRDRASVLEAMQMTAPQAISARERIPTPQLGSGNGNRHVLHLNDAVKK